MHLLLVAAVDTTSAAYRQGEVVGKALVVVFALGIVALFVISLVKAITRKTTGWIVGCVISGILSVVLILGGIGLAFGSFAKEAMEKAKTASHRTKPVSSGDGSVTLRIPLNWRDLPGLNADATVHVGLEIAEQYLTILPSPKSGYNGDLQAYDAQLMKNLVEKLKDPDVSEAVAENVGPYPAIRHRVEGEIKGLHIVYYSTAVETQDCYYQIFSWTLKSRDAVSAPVLKQVTDSFTAVSGPPVATASAASAATKLVYSKDGMVTLRVPSAWGELLDLNVRAVVQAGLPAAEQYVIVVPTSKEDYTKDLKSFDQLSTDNLAAKLKDAEISDPVSEPAGEYPALRRRLAGEIKDTNLVYYSTTLETKDSYYRILGWTLKSHDAASAPVLKKVADSFTAATDPPDTGAVDGPGR